MNKYPSPDDLNVFLIVARNSSFVRAADHMGVSTAYVTKRIRVLEAAIGIKLLHRTTRKVSLTEGGEVVYQRAQRVLGSLDKLVEEADPLAHEPKGHMRICSSFGFGRNMVAPAIARMTKRYPELEVRFEVIDRVIDPVEEGFDLDVRIGDKVAPHLVARPLAENYRVLCASPDYLRRRGTPNSLRDLAEHECLVIKERDHPFGTWELQSGKKSTTTKVNGSLSTNHGEVAVQWAIDGHGILLRSIWNIGPALESGALVRVLSEYRQDANAWAVYPPEAKQSAKIRVCVEYLRDYFSRVGALKLTP